MTLKEAGSRVPYLTSSALSFVGHSFTTRIGGISKTPFASLNLGHRAADPDANVLRNRQIACLTAGAPAEKLTCLRQKVGPGVVRVTGELAGRQDAVDGDALVTDIPGVP